MGASSRMTTPASRKRSEVAEGVPDRVTTQVDAAFEAEVDAGDLARAVAATLAAEGDATSEVTIAITDDDTIAALNRQYRGVEGPTDVLSFPAQTPTPGFVSAPEAATYLGDIVIALPFTRSQAAELGRSLGEELRLLAVHGALHLLGYDHAEPGEEAAMWAWQAAILAGLGG